MNFCTVCIVYISVAALWNYKRIEKGRVNLNNILKNMKIKKSLIIGFAIVIVASLAIIFSCLLMISQQRSQFETLLNEDVRVGEDILYARLDSAIIGRNIRDALLVPDSEANDDLIARAKECLTEMENYLESIEANYPYQLDRALMEKYVADARAWMSNSPMLIQLYEDYHAHQDAAHLEEAVDFIYTTDTPLQTTMQDSAKELDAYLVEGLQAERDKIENNIKTATLAIIAVMVVVTVTVILIALRLIKSITDPTEEVKNALIGFSQGKLDIPVTFEGSNELGEMCVALRNSQDILHTVIQDINYVLNEMAHGNFDVRTRAEDKYVGALAAVLASMRTINRQLSGTLQQIGESAEQVSSGSEQIANSSQALAQGATEQASAIEELTANVLDISGQVNKTAERAKDAKTEMDTTGDKVETCNVQMQEMTKAMDEITDRSNEISKIIKTIEDIAFQTNILALNAAVEAARAGAAGKGFAVVADEVRNLAAKSAEASKNTADLIGGTVDAVNRGSAVVNETAETLFQIVEGTKTVSGLVAEITEDAQREAEALKQARDGIEEIARVVHMNSASSEESASASVELSTQAVRMKELMEQFTLRRY